MHNFIKIYYQYLQMKRSECAMKSENNRNRTKGNNISQQKELREQQQNLEEFKNDVNKKFVNIEKM